MNDRIYEAAISAILASAERCEKLEDTGNSGAFVLLSENEIHELIAALKPRRASSPTARVLVAEFKHALAVWAGADDAES